MIFFFGKNDARVKTLVDSDVFDFPTTAYNIGVVFTNETVSLSGKYGSNATNLGFIWKNENFKFDFNGIVKNSEKNYFETQVEGNYNGSVLGVSANSDKVGVNFGQQFSRNFWFGAKLMYDPLEEALFEQVVFRNRFGKLLFEKDQTYGKRGTIDYRKTSSFGSFFTGFEINESLSDEPFTTKTYVGYETNGDVKIKSLALFDNNMKVTKDSDTLYPPIVFSTAAEIFMGPTASIGITMKVDCRNNIYDFGLKIAMLQ